VPDEVILNSLFFLFSENTFFNPADWLPTLKLDKNLVGIDDLNKIEKNVSLNGVSCEIEGFVDLNEGTWHLR